MARPLALDLFCGAGGASMGLFRAGFDVIGVDIRPQPHYPFPFVRGDALEPPFNLRRFDFVWASPVCKRFTRCWHGQPERRLDFPDQISAIRQILAGAMFDLPIVRDRVFEFHVVRPPFALAPQHSGTTRRGDLAMVAGHGGAMKGWNRRNWDRPHIRARLFRRNSAAGWREAMAIDWMTRSELSQAVPPAYSEYVGRAALQQMRLAA